MYASGNKVPPIVFDTIEKSIAIVIDRRSTV